MRFAALALLLGMSCTARAAEPDVYIFDALALQPYKGNFARLVKGDGIPDWVKAIAVQGAGTAGPSRTVDVGGTPYRLDHVCKVDACAGNTLDVLWAPRGAKVWAALVEGGGSPVMLGGPKDAQLKALEQATGSAVPGGTSAPAAVVATTAPAAPPAPVAATAPAARPSSAAEADSYIFDVLALQPYKGSFARLVKGRAAPDWVKAISVQGAGTAGPSKTVDVGGTPYRLDRVCKVGACAGNTIDVLWGPGGSRVWAALTEGGQAPVLLGDPKGAQARALTDAASGAPAPAVATPAPSSAGSPPAPATPAQASSPQK